MSEKMQMNYGILERLKKVTVGMICISLTQSIIWIGLFSTPLFRGSVFFYRGIFLLALSAILVVLGLIFGRRLLSQKIRALYEQYFSLESSFSAIVFCSSLCLSFFVIVPVTIERSVTTFMLGRMEKAGPMTMEQIRNLLAVDYMNDTNAVERRTSEQTISGNLKINLEGAFEVTNNAKLFLRFSELIAKIFAVNPSYKIQSTREE